MKNSSKRWNWGNPDLKMTKGGAAQFGNGDNSSFTLTGLTPAENYDIIGITTARVSISTARRWAIKWWEWWLRNPLPTIPII